LAVDFERILKALPPDWTDLELDLRIDDEREYVDTAGTPLPPRRSRACWRSWMGKA